jgi:phosphohistidine phosphatase
LPQECSSVLAVGHNPGLQELLFRLTGADERFATAALAWIELSIDDWSTLDRCTRGRLVRIWRPKELDD